MDALTSSSCCLANPQPQRVVACVPLTPCIRDFVSLTKPGIVLCCTGMCFVGAWIAPGEVHLQEMLSLLIGLAALVGGANALNMCAEQTLDALMHRTQQRALPAGRLSLGAARWFGWSMSGIGLLLLGCGAHPLSTGLAVAAFLLYLLAYTPLKRKTPLALLVGSVSGALPPLIGWTAVQGRIGLAGCVLFAIVFFWQIPHFVAITLYAERDYAQAGIRTINLCLGFGSARRVALIGTSALVPLTVILILSGTAGLPCAALVLSASCFFLISAVRLLRVAERRTGPRQLFLFSVAYLPLVALSLILDRLL